VSTLCAIAIPKAVNAAIAAAIQPIIGIDEIAAVELAANNLTEPSTTFKIAGIVIRAIPIYLIKRVTKVCCPVSYSKTVAKPTSKPPAAANVALIDRTDSPVVLNFTPHASA